jgi:hypothetical protein
LNQKYLRVALTLLISTTFGFSQEEFTAASPLTSETPSSWVSRLWQGLFASSGRSIVPEPANIPLYLPPPPPAPCLIKPLAPIEDEDALAFEAGFGELGRVHLAGLTRPTARAMTRFEHLVTRAGGSFSITSAHRPVAYQLHLQQVWDKWMEVRDITTSECDAIRAEAEREFYHHGLLETQRPASFSDHTRGTAFDARVQLPPVARLNRKKVCVDTLARMAGLYRPVAANDPVHFRIRTRS